jgi:hypothetical protein
MPHDARPDPPASTLARGPAKTDDIERSRRDLRRAEKGVTDVLRAEVARHEHALDHHSNAPRGGARSGA